MVRRQLPPELVTEHPALARLIERRVRRLPPGTRDELLHRAAAGPAPLVELWTGSGCAQQYGYAIHPDELPGAPRANAATSSPALADTCYGFVEGGARGAAPLLAAVAWAAVYGDGPGEVPRVLVQCLRAQGRLACAAGPDGFFRAARLLAVHRSDGAGECVVEPLDLFIALALLTTNGIHGALHSAGLPLERLDATRTEWTRRLGRARLARLRLAAYFPPPLVVPPPDWRVDEVAPADGVVLTLPDAEEVAPQLDVLWLAREAAANAPLDGLPVRGPHGKEKARLSGVRDVLDRHAPGGWTQVFGAALRAVGWQPPPGPHVLISGGMAVSRRTPAEAAAQAPEDPADAVRREFADLRAALRSTVIGEDLADRLAIVALLHRHGTRRQRLLLSGPSGVGKSHAARALARATGSRWYAVDATDLTETGFRGTNVPELIGAMYNAAGRSMDELRRMVLVVDEADKLRVGADTDGNSADKTFSMQSCLLSLFGGSDIIFQHGGSDMNVDTSGMLIVCTGAFSSASWSDERAPETADLVKWGLQNELAERLTDRIFIAPRSAPELVSMYSSDAEGVAATVQPAFEAIGCRVEVSAAACARVARLVAAGYGGAGPRSGSEILLAAARRLLLRALTDAASAGTTYTVTPDDLEIPHHGRSR